MDETARWPHDAILHAWWVEPGRLLAGEYPGARTAEKAAQKVRLLIDAGIDSIVDLTTPDDHLDPYQEPLPAAAKEAERRIRHFAHPIPDMGVIDPEGYDAIIARILREMGSGRVVYVHCWGGKARTSTVVGCLLIDGGLDYDAAVARIAELRAGTRKAVDPCPESRSQHQVLRERAALTPSKRRRRQFTQPPPATTSRSQSASGGAGAR
jgi:protein-tyrosine phosphatase